MFITRPRRQNDTVSHVHQSPYWSHIFVSCYWSPISISCYWPPMPIGLLFSCFTRVPFHPILLFFASSHHASVPLFSTKFLDFVYVFYTSQSMPWPRMIYVEESHCLSAVFTQYCVWRLYFLRIISFCYVSLIQPGRPRKQIVLEVIKNYCHQDTRLPDGCRSIHVV